MSAPFISEPAHTEEQKVRGEQLLAKVREIIESGNAKRIIVRSAEGHTILEIPVTLGVVAAALLPLWVAIGAIAALAADYQLVVEKEPEVDEQCRSGGDNVACISLSER